MSYIERLKKEVDISGLQWGTNERYMEFIGKIGEILNEEGAKEELSQKFVSCCLGAGGLILDDGGKYVGGFTTKVCIGRAKLFESEKDAKKFLRNNNLKGNVFTFLDLVKSRMSGDVEFLKSDGLNFEDDTVSKLRM